MTIPEAFPMMKPFREAIAHQLQRVPMSRADFDRLELESRARAWTIAGLTRRSALEQTHELATRAIAEGLTRSEFAEQLGEILDKQGVILDPQRLELINQNNLATAHAAGRWQQMTHPDVIASRPYWQYPPGPDDRRTSAICKKLQGFCARHDDPVWPHIFPPNHHKERHLKVLTLTEEEAKAAGIYESAGPKEYPVIDGQEILPDPGFDYSPSLLGADEAHLVASADKLGVAVPAKIASDYSLPLLEKMPAKNLPALPVAIDGEWDAFRETLAKRGVGTESSAVLADIFGDGVRVTRGSFDRISRPELASAIAEAIEHPSEVWAITREAGDRLQIHKRYIALFRDGDQVISVIVDESPDGWLMAAEFPELELAESFRAGRLLLTELLPTN